MNMQPKYWLLVFSICGLATQYESRSLASGDIKHDFAFEMIMTKLQILQDDIGVIKRNENREKVYTSCDNVPALVSGMYKIQPERPFKEPIAVNCDQEYDNGGWVVIQHRFDGSTNFYRNWQEYKNGFGNLDGEFWLGLDRIYQLTVSRPHELVILLEDFDGNKTYAKYDRFEIGDEASKYVIKYIEGYSGTAGDSMDGLKGFMWTTMDSDNDSFNENCATRFSGAWWYGACHQSNLNGLYLRGETKEYASGMVWYSFRGYDYALKSTKMMIKPK
ncbi:ficolin-2-like [Anopheles nili]|uniref:ficolin-2-like n=1 Tax=Anopheles nili TaxID=185578 RepID=UPI00237A6243|nr:ficolin-2-like [Anopheles nili]